MPIYEFICEKCHTRISELRKMGDYSLPECCGKVEMAFSVPAVNVWNADWRFPNLSTEGDGSASFATEHDYRAKLRECGVEESSLGVKEV